MKLQSRYQRTLTDKIIKNIGSSVKNHKPKKEIRYHEWESSETTYKRIRLTNTLDIIPISTEYKLNVLNIFQEMKEASRHQVTKMGWWEVKCPADHQFKRRVRSLINLGL